MTVEKVRKTRTRAAGEGTIYQNEKRGRWEGQFPYNDPETGKTKRKLIIGKSQTEVSIKGKAFLRSIEDGLLPNSDKLTVWRWLQRWLEDYIKPNVRIKSYEKYESCLKSYIKPTLGEVIITKLKAPDVQKVFNEMLTKGGKKKQGVSTSTVRSTRRYLSMAFEKAVQVGVISKNIIKATDPPRQVKREIQPLTEEQASMLLKTAKEGEYIYYGCKQRQKPDQSTEYLKAAAHTAVLLALNTGMRAGEVFGLKWSDVDFAKNTVKILRSLVASNHGVHFEDPKTKGSRRKVPITNAVKKALQKFQKEQQWFANALGDQFNNEENLIFPNSAGKPFNTTDFTARFFKRMILQAGLNREFCFHDLRHTHATLLLKQGVNIKVISERLGHSTIQMTLDTYSHLMPDMQQTAVKALEELNIN
jgi:integrase